MTSDRAIADVLAPAAGILGSPLAPNQLEQITRYLALVAKWSRRARLTAITRPTDAARLHVLDSLLGLRAGIPSGSSVLDVGSGAGLPGIPLKIARPDLVMTLLEAASRKAAFLEVAAVELGLAIEVVESRAEAAGHQPRFREQFDVAVARAVAPLAALSELTLPFVRLGGKAVLLKGPAVAKEIGPGRRAASLLGGAEPRILPVGLPGGPQRTVVEIVKVAPTPLVYPRRPGVPAKRPLGG